MEAGSKKRGSEEGKKACRPMIRNMETLGSAAYHRGQGRTVMRQREVKGGGRSPWQGEGGCDKALEGRQRRNKGYREGFEACPSLLQGKTGTVRVPRASKATT